MPNETLEIRWHGRGGQGAITAAKIFGQAAFASGFAGVVMAPSFGTERRGAPVEVSLKISKTKINDLSPIEHPDVVVVLDDSILREVNVTAGMKPGGILVVNTPARNHAYTALADARNPTFAEGRNPSPSGRGRVRGSNDVFSPMALIAAERGDATRPDISSPHLASPGGRGTSAQDAKISSTGDQIRLATADVTQLAEQAGLKRGVINTGIIGALAKALPIVPLSTLLEAIELEFAGKKAAENAEAARMTHAHTIME